MTGPFDIEHRGWAPCMHTEEEQIAAKIYINERKAELAGDGTDEFNPFHGGLLEAAMWNLSLWDIDFDCYADMWTCVVSFGEIGGRKTKVEIQGDTFLLAMLETFRWYRDKRKEFGLED